MHRYVIVGSGAAGIAAAEAIRGREPNGEIILVSEERFGYYSRPGLAYYLTGEIPQRALFPFSENDFRGLNLRPLHKRVHRILPQSHSVVFQDGKTISYDRLLIATGSSAVIPSLPGIELEGVIKLDNMEDAQRIHKLARHGRNAVVVGGGITALEIVEGLISRGVRTTYFLRGDRYWSNVLDETESHIVEQRLEEEKVRIHYNTELDEILGRRGRVAGVRTKDGRKFDCDIVAIAIGVRPRLELAKASGLDTDRGIAVNEFLQTSYPDIYAAGDVAQVINPVTGKSILDTLWGPARDQGRIAGLNMTGQTTPFCKEIPFNVTRLAGLTTTIIGTVGRGEDVDLLGIARGDSETWRQLPDAIAAQGGFDVNHLRILVGKETLLGAIVMGDQTLSQPIQQLVGRRVDITPVREKLLQPDVPLGDIIVDFWTQWKRNYAERPARSKQ